MLCLSGTLAVGSEAVSGAAAALCLEGALRFRAAIRRGGSDDLSLRTVRVCRQCGTWRTGGLEFAAPHPTTTAACARTLVLLILAVRHSDKGSVGKPGRCDRRRVR